jgi:hypothetical protein
MYLNILNIIMPLAEFYWMWIRYSYSKYIAQNGTNNPTSYYLQYKLRYKVQDTILSDDLSYL